MGARQYVIGYFRVLFSLGLYGWLAFLAAAFLGIGAAQDYGSIRKSFNQVYKSLVGADMPATIPWFFIAAVFVVIALIRLVHRHVMWEAVLPHLAFSQPKTVTSGLDSKLYFNDGTMVERHEVITIGFIEVSNKPSSRVEAKEAADAWVTASFENDVTKEVIVAKFCRWEGNLKPREDFFPGNPRPRYMTDWNVRTLPPNGMPHRVDFCVFREGDGIYGFTGYAQEKPGWAEPALKLWQQVTINVTLTVEAKNLDPSARHSFKMVAGQTLAFL